MTSEYDPRRSAPKPAPRQAQPMNVPMRPGTGPSGPGAARPQRPVMVPAGAAQAPSQSPEEEESDDAAPVGFMDTIKQWASEAGGAYVASMLFHTALFLFLFLVLGARYIQQKLNESASFDSLELTEDAKSDIKPLQLDQPADEDPSKIDTTKNLVKGEEDSKVLEGPPVTQTEKFISDAPEFVDEGGGLKSVVMEGPQLGGAVPDFASLRTGPALKGPGGLGTGGGEGDSAGIGGSGTGLGGRGQGHRKAMIGRYGGTASTERAVNAALNWLARHQSKDGSWSLGKFNAQCNYGIGTCDGPGTESSDAAATALGLLPFFGAGLTHNTKGEYQQTIRRGLDWLMKNQKANGDLSGKTNQTMYTHGLCTIAMCEAFALSKDSRIGYSAQGAINFIQAAQDKNGGGWRYVPGQPGDTSVVGWQVMALKSGQMAKLNVSPAALDGARKYLAMASGSEYGWQFGYAGPGPTPTMASVGLLCRQYLGAAKGDPGLIDGRKYLMQNMPDEKNGRSIYYWYYATQVLHNMLGDEWETWNRKMRKILVNTQARQGCVAGSWDPDKPSADAWGRHGGRIMTTSLSCLTLEIYYRYLPLYDLEKKGAVNDGPDLKGGKEVDIKDIQEMKEKGQLK